MVHTGTGHFVMDEFAALVARQNGTDVDVFFNGRETPVTVKFKTYDEASRFVGNMNAGISIARGLDVAIKILIILCLMWLAYSLAWAGEYMKKMSSHN